MAFGQSQLVLEELPSDKWSTFDELMSNQKIASTFHRKVRSFKEHGAYWKASECLVYLLYLTPLLQQFMEIEYYEHLCLLVNSVRLLMCKTIKKSVLKKVQDDLDTFVLKFSKLYGENMCSMNVHNLIHLVDNVIMHGPLWAYSCFVYESFNHILLKGIHGSYMCQMSAVRSIHMFQIAKSRVNKLSIIERAIYDKIRNVVEYEKQRERKRIEEGVQVKFNNIVIQVMCQVSKSSKQIHYACMKLNNTFYEARDHSTQSTYNDSFAILNDKSSVMIKTIYFDVEKKLWKANVEIYGSNGLFAAKRVVGLETISGKCIGLVQEHNGSIKHTLVPMVDTHRLMLK